MEITGIILAGGKSSRFGEDKGLYNWNDSPMIHSSIMVAQTVCSRVIIVSNDPNYKQFNIEVVQDVVKDKGPIGGIYTGLMKSSTDVNLILSCDIPLISKDVIELLLENHSAEVTLVKERDRMHPLIGIYNRSVIPALKSAIDKEQFKLWDALKNCEVEFVSIDDSHSHHLANINSKEDLNKWQTK